MTIMRYPSAKSTVFHFIKLRSGTNQKAWVGGHWESTQWPIPFCGTAGGPNWHSIQWDEPSIDRAVKEGGRACKRCLAFLP
jgi:hypothetical protein